MKKQLDFFNTISLEGDELKEARKTVSKQNDRILLIMKSGRQLTPFDVHFEYEKRFKAAPITSIRRAMTTLTDCGKLKKLDQMVEAEYGKRNHLWQLV
jgi:Fe2+ or Zn2+ uptake regulation protein